MDPRNTEGVQSAQGWYERTIKRAGAAWNWAQRHHLPALLSAVLLGLLLVAERKLLKDVLRAQESLKDALGDLRHTVDDELREARSALQDTRVLEGDIRSRLDSLHGRELSDVPALARALTNELDAGVARARGLVTALGPADMTPPTSRSRPERSLEEELEVLASELAEARQLALDVSARARRADEALGASPDGGVEGLPDLRAQASRIAQKLAQADAVMFSRSSPPGETGLAVAKDRIQHASLGEGDSFPPLYARAHELSVALDRSYARIFGDGGVQDASDLLRKLREVQTRLQLFQARLDRIDANLRVEEAAVQRKVTADGGASGNSEPEQPRGP